MQRASHFKTAIGFILLIFLILAAAPRAHALDHPPHHACKPFHPACGA